MFLVLGQEVMNSKVNKKVKRLARKSALSYKLSEKKYNCSRGF